MTDQVVDATWHRRDPAGTARGSVHFERVTTATVISEVLLAYNGERYQGALTLYRNAAATPAGEQLRVVNGLYRATWKLGRASEAEEALETSSRFGLRSYSLGVIRA